MFEEAYLGCTEEEKKNKTLPPYINCLLVNNRSDHSAIYLKPVMGNPLAFRISRRLEEATLMRIIGPYSSEPFQVGLTCAKQNRKCHCHVFTDCKLRPRRSVRHALGLHWKQDAVQWSPFGWRQDCNLHVLPVWRRASWWHSISASRKSNQPYQEFRGFLDEPDRNRKQARWNAPWRMSGFSRK